MQYKTILLGILLLATSCTRLKLEKELELFTQTEIQLPKNLAIVQNGAFQDLSFDIPKHPIKLIIYYSPESCSSCQAAHLYKLEQLFCYKSDKHLFTPMIIMSPDEQQYALTLKLLKSQTNPFPVYLDRKDEFRQLNPNLPKDTRFHTFLLDRHNHIVLIGDPLLNTDMRKLFESTLNNMLSHNGEYIPEK